MFTSFGKQIATLSNSPEKRYFTTHWNAYLKNMNIEGLKIVLQELPHLNDVNEAVLNTFARSKYGQLLNSWR